MYIAGQTGAGLSFVAAGFMLLIVARTPGGWTQVRPRMLLALAALDLLSALCIGIRAFLRGNRNNNKHFDLEVLLKLGAPC
jgi:hypothetical protein